MKEVISYIKDAYRKRAVFIWDALLHVLHAFFPEWERVENKVGTPNFDHREKKKNLGHFRLNLRCVVINLLAIIWPWLMETKGE